MSMKVECKFCDPTQKPSEFLAAFGVDPYIDKATLLDTEHFKVTPDLLPVEPNGRHVLIVPKPTDTGDHFLSYAGLPKGLGYPTEVNTILDRIERAWKTKVSVFEHGSVKSGAKHQSVYHAHAHVMGTGNLNIIQYMSDVLQGLQIPHFVFENLETNSYVHNLRIIQASGKNYLSVQSNNRVLIAYDQDENGNPADTMQSQISQRNMSRLLTGEEVNWKAIFDSSNPLSNFMAMLSAQRLVSLVQNLPDCRF